MSWTDENQARFNLLRAKELAGMLADAEQTELKEYIAQIEAEEAAMFAPGMDRLRAEVEQLKRDTEATEARNEALAKLLVQEMTLIADAKRFLAEFDRRQTFIANGLSKLKTRTA